MPSATDIVVDDGAATPVAKTFSLVSPAAGDGGLALWQLKEGTVSYAFPTFTALAAKSQGKDSGRVAKLKLKVPSVYTDTTTGLTMVRSTFEVNVSVSVPDTFPEAAKADAVAFTSNLLGHTLVKQLIRDAVSAT